MNTHKLILKVNLAGQSKEALSVELPFTFSPDCKELQKVITTELGRQQKIHLKATKAHQEKVEAKAAAKPTPAKAAAKPKVKAVARKRKPKKASE